ncbi:MAG: XRE family transcriptional regulator [Sphingobacteriia bacterium]|nr:XRE family transcriptional regulator [Sphingobacteriia bacterium]
MTISYKKLWHLLIDKGMNKSALQKASGITWTSISKLSRNENVNTEVLLKICSTLKCDISDIMELNHDE